jgi:uncharacterized UBP type Zn finger protein
MVGVPGIGTMLFFITNVRVTLWHSTSEEHPRKSRYGNRASRGRSLTYLHSQRDEPPPKISKLAIAAETEEDRYDIATSVVCYSCPQKDVDKTSGKLPVVIEGVMNAMTFSKREEVKAWEQEFVPCEHTLCLVQQDIEDPDAKGITSYHIRMETVTDIRMQIPVIARRAI